MQNESLGKRGIISQENNVKMKTKGGLCFQYLTATRIVRQQYQDCILAHKRCILFVTDDYSGCLGESGQDKCLTAYEGLAIRQGKCQTTICNSCDKKNVVKLGGGNNHNPQTSGQHVTRNTTICSVTVTLTGSNCYGQLQKAVNYSLTLFLIIFQARPAEPLTKLTRRRVSESFQTLPSITLSLIQFLSRALKRLWVSSRVLKRLS